MNKKGFFRIGEISQLFGIGVDSIRYYEKVGLLHPVRNADNNYRLYTMDDIRSMNTIRELLEIGFSTDEILQFEKDRNLKHVTAMLNQESSVIDEKIRHLMQIKGNINSRLRSINDSMSLDTSGTIHLNCYSERECVMITKEGMKDSEINYRLAEFTSSSDQKVTTIGACDCYILDTGGHNDEYDDYATKAVFFYSPYIHYDSNFTLPEGRYVTLAYTGPYTHTTEYYPLMLSYCREKGLTPVGDLMELCHIDRYETSDISEYVTELQLRVKS